MKNNLENSVKQSLEGFELPYDASAWTAFSQKLDVVKPVSTPTPKGGAGKWIVAAGIVTVVSVGSYLYMTNDAEPKTATAAAETTIETQNNEQKSQSTSDINASKEQKSVDSAVKNEKISENKEATSIKEQKSNSNLDNTWFDDSKSKKEVTSNPTTSSATASNGKVDAPVKSKTFKVPFVKDICVGDAITIKNENDSDLILALPNGKRQIIRKSTNLNSKATVSGEYHLISEESEIASFKVNKLPNLDFTIDDQLIAENGVPTVPVATYSEGSNFTWIAEGINRKLSGKTQDIHFFTQGTKTITLQAENEKGCVGEVSKTIKIEEDYNLFAPNAVNPWSSDRRKNRFIPRALNVRDVQFTMLIVDLKTGVIVYMTTDANEGWDGVDKNTGELVPEGSVYAWKVHLKNPLPGEPSDYKGTVEVSNH